MTGGDSRGLTALHAAAKSANQLEILSLLLQHGSPINTKDSSTGRTALHIAADQVAQSSTNIPSLVSKTAH